MQRTAAGGRSFPGGPHFIQATPDDHNPRANVNKAPGRRGGRALPGPLRGYSGLQRFVQLWVEMAKV